MNYPQPPPSIWLSPRVNYETYIQRWAQSQGIPYYPGMHQDILQSLVVHGSRYRRYRLNMDRLVAEMGTPQVQGWLFNMAMERYNKELMSEEGDALDDFMKLEVHSLPPEWQRMIETLSDRQADMIRRSAGRVGAAIGGYIQDYWAVRDAHQEVMGRYLDFRSATWQAAFPDTPPFPPATRPQPNALRPPTTSRFSTVTHTGFHGSTVRQRKYLKGATVDGKKVGGQWGEATALTDQEKQQVGEFIKEALKENYQEKFGQGVTGHLKQAVAQATIDLGFGGEGGEKVLVKVTLADIQYDRMVPANPKDTPGGFRWVSRSTNEYARYAFFGSQKSREPVRAKKMTWFSDKGRHQVFSSYAPPVIGKNIFELTPTQHSDLVGLLSQVFGENIQYEIAQA